MKKYSKIKFFILIITVGFGASLPQGISIHQLSNGLSIILIENRSLPMVGINVVVKTGSAYETFSTSGMSHMLEHLLFNGTTTRSQKELYDATDQIGGYNNANTGNYYTNFMMVTPAENILQGMKIQSDMLFNSTLPEENFEKEKGIVMEEIAQSMANPAAQIDQDIQSILFKNHSLSLPTLGTYATIKSLPLASVRSYYEGTYVPNNMVLSVIGNFNSDEMLEWIKNIYGQSKPGSVFRPIDSNFATGFELSDLILEDIYHRSHKDSTTLIHLAFPLLQYPESGFFELLDEILPSKVEILELKAEQKFKELSNISAELLQSPVKNFLILKATTQSEKNLDAIILYLNNAVKNMKFSMTKEAVTAFSSSHKTSFFKNLEKPHMFGIYNAHVFAQEGIDGFLSSFNTDIFITAASLLKRFRIKGNPIVILHHPMINKNDKIKNISAVELFEDDGTGTTLIVKQNSTSSLLAVHYLFKHKAQFENQYGEDAAKILHDCFDQRMKTPEVQKIISKYGLTFTVNDNPYIPMDNIYLHDDFGYIRVEGLADNINHVISFLNSSFLEFIPSEKEFNKATSTFSGKHGSMMKKNNAKEKFNNLIVDKTIIQRDSSNSVSKLTYTSLLLFEKQYWTPENLIISIVSPERPERIRKFFSNFGKSDKNSVEPRYTDAYKINNDPISVEYDGGGSQSYLFWGFIKEIDPTDRPALTALSLILSDKIIFNVREKQGLAYRMSAGINIKKDKALFSIRLGTRPENIDILVPQLSGFFLPGIIEDISNSKLEKSINMYLGRMMFRRLSSINQAYYLGYSQYFEGNMDADELFLNQLKRVSLEEVNRVAVKYLDEENPIIIISR